MQALDVVWHLLNFFAPALGIGVLAPLLAKAFWRAELRGVRWRALVAWTTAAAALALVAGLCMFGRDGRMATYVAMVSAVALSLWSRGFRTASR